MCKIFCNFAPEFTILCTVIVRNKKSDFTNETK